MPNIKEMSNTEIKYGIMRCNARLAGVMPMGIMTTEMTKKALKEYTSELSKRGLVI